MNVYAGKSWSKENKQRICLPRLPLEKNIATSISLHPERNSFESNDCLLLFDEGFHNIFLRCRGQASSQVAARVSNTRAGKSALKVPLGNENMSPTNRAQRYFVTKANPAIGNGQLCVLKRDLFRKTSRIYLFGSRSQDLRSVDNH